MGRAAAHEIKNLHFRFEESGVDIAYLLLRGCIDMLHESRLLIKTSVFVLIRTPERSTGKKIGLHILAPSLHSRTILRDVTHNFIASTSPLFTDVERFHQRQIR